MQIRHLTHSARLLLCLGMLLFQAACTSALSTSLPDTITPSLTALPSGTPASITAPTTAATVPPPTATLSPTVVPLVPDFSHIIVIVFENAEFGTVIGNPGMPNYNRYAAANTLLTQYYAITHPSLPNYIALFSGDTHGITSDCTQCFVSGSSLPDQIEASGRTWRAYLESMPRPCFVGDSGAYAQKHNPFIYFDPIRTNLIRCEHSIVPLTQLDADMAAGSLPNFVYIMPNICNSAHDAPFNPACSLGNADQWLSGWISKLQAYLDPRAAAEPYLIVVTWDEGQGDHSCCGLPAQAGGRIATVLISPLAKSGFQDSTPYTHYSMLKTIEQAWGLAFLGHAGDMQNVLITAPWK